MGSGMMIEYILLVLPSLAAGGLGLALRQVRAQNRALLRANEILRAAVSEASTRPDAFAQRVAALRAPGSRVASRAERIALLAAQRRAARAERSKES
jgi:hypothetical protein